MDQLIEPSPVKNEKKSLLPTLAALLVITLVSGGAGFAVSATMLSPVGLSAGGEEGEKGEKDKKGEAREGAKTKGENAGKTGASDEPPVKLAVTEVPAITTNLADPSDSWIRLEAALVFEEAVDETVASDVHQDIVAYLRTVRLYNLRGGSGYQHLIEDLQERAQIRSQGRVKRVLIRSLVIE